jgi:hypothetical protein
MNNSTLLMVGILVAVAILSAGLITVPIQQTNAQSTSFTFSQNQDNRCSGFTGCGNTGTITFARPPDGCPVC